MLYGEGLVQITLLLLETNRGNYIMRAFFSLLLSLIAITASAQEHLNLKGGLAIDGYDPVSYHQEGPVRAAAILALTMVVLLIALSVGGTSSCFSPTPNGTCRNMAVTVLTQCWKATK